MIDRRHMLIGTSLALASPSLISPAAARTLPAGTLPTGNRLAFEVLRGTKRLGIHTLTFEPKGDDLTVRVAVELIYKLAFVTLYKYKHEATERWSGGVVTALDSKTNDNGKAFTVTARRNTAGLTVEATGLPPYTAPANAHPATHWNRTQLDGPWINTQDGKLLRPKITPAGPETIRIGKAEQPVTRYTVSGEVDMTMFYDTTTWAGLTFTGKDGSPIRYQRM